MKNIAILCMLSILTSCGGGISNFTENLGHGYTFDHSGPTLKMIRSSHSSQNHIYGTVTSFCYNDDFILVCQIPSREAHKAIIGFELRYQATMKFPNRPELNIEKSEELADSILYHNSHYQKIFLHKLNYWIISHKRKKMYGPLTKIEYLAKRKELNVPDDLKLEGENN